MQDRFKFRAWDNQERYYIPDEETNFCHGMMEYWLDKEDCPLVFEQCTGMKDKNGKLIYEGDIVEAYDYTIEHSQVVWDKGCYVLKSKDVAMYEHLSSYEKKFKIIGNIHENPELLEEDK